MLVQWSHKGRYSSTRTSYRGEVAASLPNNVALVKCTAFKPIKCSGWIPSSSGYHRVARHRLTEICKEMGKEG